jgi:transcriptional antiterminator Rof (Rho-off)
MKEEYKSVSCGFYDELGALAVSHKSCEIIFWNENGAKTITRDSIKNLYSKEGVEYLETGNGAKIRLDRLSQVDGKTPNNQC